MDIGSWPWTRVLLVSIGYWAVLFMALLVHRTRPTTQARARSRALRTVHQDPMTGRMKMAFQDSIRLDRIAVVLFAPPALLMLLRLML